MGWSAVVVLWLLLLVFPARGAQVALSWQDNANNEDHQRIYRALGTGALLTLQEVPANVTTFTDDSVQPGATYRYQVAALNTAGEAKSNIATVTIPPGATLPAAPTTIEVQIPGNLVNVSTRGLVTASDTTIIPGFIVTDGPVRVLVRVVGPTLAQLGLPATTVCADPRFEIRNQQGGAVVAANDDWSGAEVAAANAATGLNLAAGSKDAAVVVTLPPGQYTVVARSNGGDGIALAEVYKLLP